MVKKRKWSEEDYVEAAAVHEKYTGKVAIVSKAPMRTRRDLSLLYTPGVARPSSLIGKNIEDVWKYTFKKNTVAVVSDGTAILGLGDLGPEAAIPVMEGKAVLFKKFGDVDAWPLCIATKDVNEIVRFCELIAPTFGGINLEDISAPRCIEVMERLRHLNIPVMHDDQSGTATVVMGALINALRVVDKKMSEINVTICGGGSAGLAIARMLLNGDEAPKRLRIVDINGIVYPGDKRNNKYQEAIVKDTNKEKDKGDLAHAFVGADVFIGVSKAGIVTPAMVKSMNEGAIVFAMANPTPEIMPDLAKEAGAVVVGTGRSDFPNQVNNAVGFPGIFRGALDARARKITPKMRWAAAYALADLIPKPNANKIVASAMSLAVGKAVGKEVAKAWEKWQDTPEAYGNEPY